MSFSRAICARPILARRERKALYPFAVPPHCSALASGYLSVFSLMVATMDLYGSNASRGIGPKACQGGRASVCLD